MSNPEPETEYRVRLIRGDISADQLAEVLSRGGIKEDRMVVDKVGGATDGE